MNYEHAIKTAIEGLLGSGSIAYAGKYALKFGVAFIQEWRRQAGKKESPDPALPPSNYDRLVDALLQERDRTDVARGVADSERAAREKIERLLREEEEQKVRETLAGVMEMIPRESPGRELLIEWANEGHITGEHGEVIKGETKPPPAA